MKTPATMMGCMFNCERDRQECKNEAREKLGCAKSSFQQRCADDCRLSGSCRKTCKIQNHGMGFKMCHWGCLNMCRVACEKKARVVAGQVSLHRRCERYIAKNRYIDYLQSRVELKKKRSKVPKAAYVKYDAVLMKKRRRVAVFLKKYRCMTVKKNPFCSKVRVNVKCKNASNDVHGTKMRTIQSEIAKLEVQQKNACKKKPVVVAVKKPIVKKPAAKRPNSKGPVKKPMVHACTKARELKAQVKAKYDERVKLANQLNEWLKKGKLTNKDDQLKRDQLSQQVNVVRDALVNLLREARNAELACKKK